MLSTVLEIGAIVALIGGVAYFFFQYAPYIVSFFNSAVNIVLVCFDYIPDYLQPFLLLSLTFAGIGLAVKLL